MWDDNDTGYQFIVNNKFIFAARHVEFTIQIVTNVMCVNNWTWEQCIILELLIFEIAEICFTGN
jgi:hypothetical protein